MNYVVTWAYSDGSAHGVVAVFADAITAEWLRGILAEVGDIGRHYAVVTVPTLPASLTPF